MKRSVLFTVLTTFIVSTMAAAQGIIVPEPHPERPLPPVRQITPEVLSQSVDIRIEGSAAVTTVEQVFKNKWSETLEGTYIFPLPPGATVSEFALWIDGKKVQGQLLDRDEAAQIYRDIVRRMKDPALLEMMAYDLFKASVFPIPAGGERKIQLSYAQELTRNAGLIRYRYPLKVRGSGDQSVGSFSLAAKIRQQSSITSLYSPSHEIGSSIEGTVATASMEESNFVAQQDFQLYITTSDKEFGLSMAGWHEAGVDKGYFMMMLAPKTGIESGATAPRDIVFVLDTSGSMQDEQKLEQAKSALTFGIRSLRTEDRFGLITFAYEVKPFREELIPATAENVQAAVSALEDTAATGATNIHDALKYALDMVKDSQRPRYVVFLTDGLPTHVERNPDVIIKKARSWAPNGVRLFTWGVGTDVDARLMDAIAVQNGGVSEYVKPREELELKLGQFFEKISHPIMTDLSLTTEGLDLSDRYPIELPDLFRGSQLVLFGRYSGDLQGLVTLEGTLQGEKRSFSYRLDTVPMEEGEFIARLWATRKTGYLLEQIRLHGESDELKEEVVGLAKKFGLVTPYTSYLVVEPEMDRFDDRGRIQPSHMQEQAAAEPRDVMAAEAPSATSGDQAVQYSKALRDYKEKKVASDNSGLQTVAGKTFVLRQGVWTDTSYEEGIPTEKAVVGSDAWFKLLELDPNMSKWLAVSDRMIIVYKGIAYIIDTQ